MNIMNEFLENQKDGETIDFLIKSYNAIIHVLERTIAC